jgi:DNA-binding NarL/FixJ family response regulator
MTEELSHKVSYTKGRRKADRVAAKAAEGLNERLWDDLVKDLHRLMGEGKTDTQIAEELKINPMLVKQVRTRSYQSTVNTKATFERFEKNRTKK